MAVPNTTTFSLTDVRPEITGESGDLADCIAKSEEYKFDQLYRGNKNSLLNFRNYGAGLGATQIGLINIRTRPWFSMGSPPSNKINKFVLVYITGASYNDSSPRNETRYVKWQSDDSILFNHGASNHAYVNTQRPKELVVATSDGTLMTPGGLYFELITSWDGVVKIMHRDMYYTSAGNIRMPFNLLSSTNSPDSISIDQSTLKWDGNLSPITTNQFSISATGDWYILVANANISCNTWYGTGAATITITVSEHDLTDYIYVQCMSSASPETLTIISYVPGYSVDFLGYINWYFYSDSGTLITFQAHNATSSPHAKDGQTSTLYWETRTSGGGVIESGSVSSGSVNSSSFAYPTANHTDGYDQLWGQVSGGSWIRLV